MMLESDTDDQKSVGGEPQSAAPGMPSCSPFGEVLKQMATACDCRAGAFMASCCKESETPEAPRPNSEPRYDSGGDR